MAQQVQLKITDKNGKELGFLGYKENDDRYITLTPEGSEYVIAFNVEEAGDTDLYSFDSGDGQTLYMDMKLKNRRIFGNTTKHGSLGWKIQNHGSRKYDRLWAGTPYVVGVGSALKKHAVRLGGKDGGARLIGAADGGYQVTVVAV